jgi:hypothetical protein
MSLSFFSFFLEFSYLYCTPLIFVVTGMGIEMESFAIIAIKRVLNSNLHVQLWQWQIGLLILMRLFTWHLVNKLFLVMLALGFLNCFVIVRSAEDRKSLAEEESQALADFHPTFTYPARSKSHSA